MNVLDRGNYVVGIDWKWSCAGTAARCVAVDTAGDDVGCWRTSVVEIEVGIGQWHCNGKERACPTSICPWVCPWVCPWASTPICSPICSCIPSWRSFVVKKLISSVLILFLFQMAMDVHLGERRCLGNRIGTWHREIGWKSAPLSTWMPDITGPSIISWRKLGNC